jgi:hypothetical protein
MYPQYQLMKTMQDERLRAAARDHLAAKARRARTASRVLRNDHLRRGRVPPRPVDNAATEEIQPAPESPRVRSISLGLLEILYLRGGEDGLAVAVVCQGAS